MCAAMQYDDELIPLTTRTIFSFTVLGNAPSPMMECRRAQWLDNTPGMVPSA